MKFSNCALGSLVTAGLVFATSSGTALASTTPGFIRRNGEISSRSLSGDHDDHDHGVCKEYEIDFVIVEGDAVRSSVEDDIVEMLAEVGIKVNTRKLSKDDFNAAEQAGDFHLSFSETWGAPYDPHAYASGWVASDEGHYQALAGIEGPVDREGLFEKIKDVMKAESNLMRTVRWEEIHKIVHDNAVMLPMWGSRIPTVLNTSRLNKYQPGNQQFDYPVHRLQVLEGLDKTVTIAPGAQTGLFETVGRLDPHTYRPNEFFANNWVYEGLVSYGSYGQILPALASSWTVTPEGDGDRYTFQIRPNVKFHDGAAWDCAAAKLNFDHVLSEPLRDGDWHGWYGLIDQIKNWECTGDMELVVDTKNRYYPFLQELSFIRPLRMLSPNSFVGEDALNSNSCHAGWGTIESKTGGPSVVCAGIDGISGTGPFKFTSRESKEVGDTTIDEEVVFSQNTDYWDGVPSIETLIIKHYESSADVKAALLDGSLDLVWGSGVLPAQDLVQLRDDEENSLSVYFSDDIQNVMILLNSGKAPLDDINVRKTIIHAIDKKHIIDEELSGIFKPVDEVFPQDAPYCDVSLTPRWDYDLEKAEFLNCPKDPETIIKEKTTTNKKLALGLGLGLGGTSVVLLAVAGLYMKRTNALESEVQELKLKEAAVSA